jgi:hypothetical protein
MECLEIKEGIFPGWWKKELRTIGPRVQNTRL